MFNGVTVDCFTNSPLWFDSISRINSHSLIAPILMHWPQQIGYAHFPESNDVYARYNVVRTSRLSSNYSELDNEHNENAQKPMTRMRLA